ncbi:MAG: hypothetical protein K1X67_14070 [Fimbriimonadaceae bacterium]|jgi:hypothetical protein|nr:hypothetical protein [Fimbriimonadaceae bacterium]
MINPIIRRSRPRVEPVLKLLPVPNPKPKLEMTRLPVFRVKQKHLEAYITSIYRFEFDFLIATSQVAGMMIEFQVDGVIPSEAWAARAHELRCGKRTRDVRLILNVLAHDEFIPTGRYVIDTAAAMTTTSSVSESARST